jgi:hypothetical protein
MDSRRILGLATQLVRKYDISLCGLTVLTEAASGAYLFNPLVAVVAGARRTIAYGRDSRFGKVADYYPAMHKAYAEMDIVDGYETVNELSADLIYSADIVTNSGHLRPIDAKFISEMKPTAVISLMWEPWEMREGEVDHSAAKRHEILVMGTNEHESPCDMRPYSPLIALKLMLEHGIALVDDRILVIGGQPTLADAIVKGLAGMGLSCRQLRIGTAPRKRENMLRWATYILVAEHVYHGQIIGDEGILTVPEIAAAGVQAVGVISGAVDADALRRNNISVFPKSIQPKGYLSYQGYELGPYPVMDLFAAGLKVGEAMARARIRGLSTRDAAIDAMKNSPAMDFERELSWI